MGFRFQQAQIRKPATKVAVIIAISEKSIIGRTPAGERILFTRLLAATRDAAVGDRYSFIPEQPHKKGVADFYGKSPALVEKAPAPEPVEVVMDIHIDHDTDSGLRDHHAKNFNPDGSFKIGPRPCELEAQRVALRSAKTFSE